ncbi:MAG TPA: DUF4115 domain-containing protein [Vicinamibacterales bacterium]
MTETPQPRPFDERAALQELERLAEKIQSTRRQRQQAVAEFESFVKTFREDRYAEMIAKDAPPAAAAAASASSERRIADAPAPVAARAPVETLASIEPQSLPRASARSGPRLNLPPLPPAQLAAVVAGLLAVVAIVMWMLSGPRETPSTAQPAAPVPASGGAPQPVASTGPSDAAPAKPRALNIEIVTLRPVWTRVIVDDQKVIERELPKDSRIPLGADRAIAIRAGDAGAIRLTVGGKDLGVLGRDGQIGTRTITAPGAPAR